MSGELQVVFIYDTLRCRKEEDDPRDAIIYFHPEEIPECRRIAICGQLMGITQFLLDMFSAPKILSLENGKFALKDFGKHYILALGCSSVTPDWLLLKQADILYQITKFFHKDIDNILTAVGEDRSLLSSKLSCIMDHYIPISQHHGDLFALTFGILPILNLPKSANHISLSATVLLQTAKLSDGVLGGIVMFQNKVIAVELVQDLARKLAFIQPYQSPPAYIATTNFPLPPGVQLLRVYVKREELEELRSLSSTYQRDESNSQSKNGKSRGRFDSIKEEDPTDVSVSSSQSLGSSFGTDCQNVSSISQEEAEVKKLSKSHNPSSFNPHPLRLFKSLENLRLHHQTEDEVKYELKKFSTSLTDPFFPYLRCDGKNISKFYLDTYAYPNPDLSQNEEDDEGKIKLESEVTEPSVELVVGKIKLAQNIEIEKKLNATDSEKENEPPKISEFQPKPTAISRPKDLALNLNSTSRAKSRRRWSTFDDMMSPVLENVVPPPQLDVSSPSKIREKSKSIGSADSASFWSTAGNTDASTLRSALLTSFQKLSSPEPDDLSDSGRGSENMSQTNKTQEDNKLKSTDFPFPPWTRNTKGKEDKLFCSSSSEVYEDIVLFIYSLGGMRLLLLLEKSCQRNQDLIQTLREYGSTSIAELESAVANVEEQSMSMGPGHHDHYCYLHYEPVWRSLAHGGRNHSMDFDVVQHMHQDFNTNPNINELIIRGDDHVVYGYQCVGSSEVYYQQGADPQPGLPMPSDLMGKVPLKAKRRLERNHNILLL